LLLFFHNSIFEISLIFEKSINRTPVQRKKRRGRKPAEEVEPEPTGNGEPRENPGEKPGKCADNLRGRTRGDIDCGKKILTRKNSGLVEWSRFTNPLKE